MTPTDFDPDSPQYGYPVANPPPSAHAPQPGGLGLTQVVKG